jgi:hypothetical protein
MNLAVFKNNPRLLYGLISVVSLALVWFPVINTITLVSRYVTLQGQPDAPRIDTQARQREDVTRLLTGEDQAKKIFSLLSSTCQANHVIVKQVELPKTTQVNGTSVDDQKIWLEGRYVDILKSLDGVSAELAPVKIASVVFELERNTNTREKVLVSQVIFQSVKLPPGNHE